MVFKNLSWQSGYYQSTRLHHLQEEKSCIEYVKGCDSLRGNSKQSGTIAVSWLCKNCRHRLTKHRTSTVRPWIILVWKERSWYDWYWHIRCANQGQSLFHELLAFKQVCVKMTFHASRLVSPAQKKDSGDWHDPIRKHGGRILHSFANYHGLSDLQSAIMLIMNIETVDCLRKQSCVEQI